MVKSFEMSTSCHISTEDLELHEEGEDVFFDSLDFLDTSFYPEASTTSYLVEKPECELRMFSFEFRGEELSTVHERRNKFLRETGLDKLVLPQLTCMEEPEGFRHNVPLEKMELDMMSNSLYSHDLGGDSQSTSSAEVLDAKENLLDHNLGQNGAAGRLNEVGSNRMVAWQESEIPAGPHYVQPLLDGATGDSVLPENQRLRRWWRSLASKRKAGGMLKNDSLSGTPDLPKALVKKVIHENSIEMTEFCMAQEVTAHKGSIKTMKFSPGGMYLATGGEDGVIRVWKVKVESSSKCLTANGSSTDKTEKVKLRTKGFNSAPAVSPDEVLRLEEVPLHEYFGHTSDILDLSWSTSDYLLSASKDKTVRMWKVGCDSCVKVFHHNDCVTCIQFNPADDRYFISGSLDGKVRIWGVHENRVVNWVDTRNIITAISYQADGKSFAVGTLSGNCRFYVYLGNDLQLDRELRLRGKKKLSGKQITGLQFCPGDPKKMMITSLDSKVWIFDGSAIIQKFGGSWKSKRHVAASFTADGRHLVSVGENSNICIRYCSSAGIALGKGAKSVFPCEHFFSEGVTVAVPWPSMQKGEACSAAHSPTPESTFVMNQHRNTLSLSSCFGARRVSATWPEEKLPAAPMFWEGRESETPVVIATGSCSGTIRLFRYSRVPMKLC